MIRIILIIIILLSIIGCKKIENKKCWSCETKEYVYDSTNDTTYIGICKPQNICDKTKSEIKEYEKTKTYGNINSLYVETKCN